MNTTHMGSTAAHITPCATDSSIAFVACGSDFCRVRFSKTNSIEIESIWLTQEGNPAYAQGPISALEQLPLSSGSDFSGRDLGGFIFAVSGDDVVFAQLDYDVR